jgi:hypothetical protein
MNELKFYSRFLLIGLFGLILNSTYAQNQAANYAYVEVQGRVFSKSWMLLLTWVKHPNRLRPVKNFQMNFLKRSRTRQFSITW